MVMNVLAAVILLLMPIVGVDNIRLDVKDRDRLEREALRFAEQGVSSPPIPLRQTFEAKAAEAPPIAAGELEIRAHVTETSLLK